MRLNEQLVNSACARSEGNHRCKDQRVGCWFAIGGGHASNEKEISHGRGSVASLLKLHRQGAVGFIGWLDVGTAIMTPVKLGADNQSDENAQTHPANGQIRTVKKPKACPTEVCMRAYLMREQVKSQATPRETERRSNKKSGTNPPRSVPIFATKWREQEKNRTNTDKCVGNSEVQIHRFYV